MQEISLSFRADPIIDLFLVGRDAHIAPLLTKHYVICARCGHRALRSRNILVKLLTEWSVFCWRMWKGASSTLCMHCIWCWVVEDASFCALNTAKGMWIKMRDLYVAVREALNRVDYEAIWQGWTKQVPFALVGKDQVYLDGARPRWVIDIGQTRSLIMKASRWLPGV